MSRIDIHPEDLFDRARRGDVSSRDADLFHAHLERCRACRFEYTLALECAEGSALLPGDDLAIARIRQTTVRALSNRQSAHVRGSHFVGVERSPFLLIALAAAVSVITLTLTSTLVRPGLAWAKTSLLSRTATSAPEGRPVNLVPSTTADQLFGRANAAQREGAASEAARLYGELERDFPGYPEELVARVLLGRLLLDRLDDTKGALTQFDSYLANPEQETLREEAMIGRALALERLGRRAEEQSAWDALLTVFPKSSYAEPARTRLDELR